MRQIELVAAYLPSTVVRFLVDNDTAPVAPVRQSFSTVVMFCDVSGFTALSEAMSKFGPEGAERIAKHLNSYFSQMVKTIGSFGGDIFKFAGDAMLVLWPDDTEMDLEDRVLRAGLCGLEIQKNLHRAELAEGVTLSVKIGIGVGEISVLHLGGALRRMEYVCVGEPLQQAFGAEHHCDEGGEVCMSPKAWAMAGAHFNAVEALDDGGARIAKDGKGSAKKSVKKVNIAQLMNSSIAEASDDVERRLRSYVAGAILPWINPDAQDMEAWGSDLRNVTVLFVNLGLKDVDTGAAAKYDDAMLKVHNVLRKVQGAVYQYEGAVNKFLIDDKGSTLIAVFGLPPLSHEDDATRGVMCALAICEQLWTLGLIASVGITTGVVFCGVVGSTTRKEYTIIGDTVNLSARLMQKAGSLGGGVLCDLQIRRAASGGLAFQDQGEIKVKGKIVPIRVFRPYPSGLLRHLRVGLPPGSEPNFMRLAYEAQLVGFRVNRLMRPHDIPPPIAGDGVKDPGEVEAAAAASGASAAAGGAAAAAAKSAPSSTSVRRGTLMPSKAAAMGLSSHVLSVEEVFGTVYVKATSGDGDGDAAVDEDGYPLADMYTMSRRVKDTLAASGSTAALSTAAAATPASGASAVVGSSRSTLLSSSSIDKRRTGAASSSSAASGRKSGGGTHMSRPDIPLSKMRCLLSKPPAPLSVSNAAFRGLPSVTSLRIHVPNGLMSDDALEVRISYESADGAELSSAVPISVTDYESSDVSSSLGAIRDAAVSAAKEAGRLHSSLAPTDFFLRVHGTDALVPTAYSLPPIWLWSFVAESNALYTDDALNASGELKVQLVRVRDHNIIQNRHAAAMQTLIESKMHLVGRKQGSACLLEGDVGLGKTSLLARFLADVMTSATSVFAAAGSPYTRMSPYAVWAELVEQYLKEYRDARSLPTSTDAAVEIIQLHATQLSLQHFASLLNPVLHLEIPASGREDSLNTAEQDSVVRALLVTFVRGMCSEAPVMLLIDDGSFLHKSSWELALELSIASSLPPDHPGALPVMLVVATRPVSSYVDLVVPEVPKAYTQMQDCPYVTLLRLARLPSNEATAVTAASMRWGGYISQDVMTMVEGKCHGNPLMIQELMLTLLGKKRLSAAESGSPEASAAGVSNVTTLVRTVMLGLRGAKANRSSARDGAPLSIPAGPPVAASFRDIFAASAGSAVPSRGPAGARRTATSPSGSPSGSMRGVAAMSIPEDAADDRDVAVSKTAETGVDMAMVVRNPRRASQMATDAFIITQAAIAAGAGLARSGAGWLSIAGNLGPVAGIIARKATLLGVDAASSPNLVLILTDGLKNTHVPYCRRTHWALGSRFDRLKNVEQIVLKVGALIGRQMRGTEAAVNLSTAASSPFAVGPTTSKGGSLVSAARALGPKAMAVASGPSGGHGDRFTITFRFDFLVECFPFRSYRDRALLASICVALERAGVLTHAFVRPVTPGAGPAEAVLTFTSGFLPDTGRFRLLAAQRENIDRVVHEVIDKFCERKARVFMEKMIATSAKAPVLTEMGERRPSETVSRFGWVRVRKNPETRSSNFFTSWTAAGKSDWKRRWLTIAMDSLSMYKEENGHSLGHKPVQVVPLRSINVTVMPATEVSSWGERFVVKVDAREWEKKGTTMSAPRSFFLACDSKVDADQWQLWLKFTSERYAIRTAVAAVGIDDSGLARASVASGAYNPDARRPSSVGLEAGHPGAASDDSSTIDSHAGDDRTARGSDASVVGGMPRVGSRDGLAAAASEPLREHNDAQALSSMFAPSPSGFGMMGNRALLTVEDATFLTPAKASGAPNVFVSVHLDGVAVATPSTSGTLDPVWGTVLGMSLSPAQAATSVLVLRVWDRDREGSDQLMGHTELALDSIKAEIISTDDVAPAAGDPGTPSPMTASHGHAEQQEAQASAPLIKLRLVERPVLDSSGITSPSTGSYVVSVGDDTPLPPQATRDSRTVGFLHVRARILLNPDAHAAALGARRVTATTPRSHAATTLTTQLPSVMGNFQWLSERTATSGRSPSPNPDLAASASAAVRKMSSSSSVSPTAMIETHIDVRNDLRVRGSVRMMGLSPQSVRTPRHPAPGLFRFSSAASDGHASVASPMGTLPEERNGNVPPTAAAAIERLEVLLSLLQASMPSLSRPMMASPGDADSVTETAMASADTSDASRALLRRTASVPAAQMAVPPSRGVLSRQITLNGTSESSPAMKRATSYVSSTASAHRPSHSTTAIGAEMTWPGEEEEVDSDDDFGPPAPAYTSSSPIRPALRLPVGDVVLSGLQAGQALSTLSSVISTLRNMSSSSEGGGDGAAAAVIDAMEVDEQDKKWLKTQYMRESQRQLSVADLADSDKEAVQAVMRLATSRRHSVASEDSRSAVVSAAAVAAAGGTTVVISTTPATATATTTSQTSGTTAASVSTPSATAVAVAAPSVPPILPSTGPNRTSVSHIVRTLTVVGDVVAGPGTAAASSGWFGWGFHNLRYVSTEAQGEPDASTDLSEPPDDAITIAVSDFELWQRQLHDGYDRIFYEDGESKMHGPYIAKDMYDWLASEAFPMDSSVRIGSRSAPDTVLHTIVPQLRLRALISRSGELSASTGDPDAWDFNIWKVGAVAPQDLIPIPVYLFVRLRLPRFFSVSEGAFLEFVDAVCTHMSLRPDDTPYHNFWHAVDVMQSSAALLTTMDAAKLFTPIETLALVVSALCHDLEHPGVNNAFLINTDGELAWRYNDHSVLENHHAATAFALMKETGVMSGLSRAQLREFRKIVIAVILSTDMTCHFGLTEELKTVGLTNASRIRTGLASSPSFARGPGALMDYASTQEGPIVSCTGADFNPPDISTPDRLVVLKNLLHAADISNPTKPWDITTEWSSRVVQEFFKQGDRERELGLPVSPNFDRATTKPSQLSVNFVDFVVAPLFVAVATILPGAQQCVEILNDNRRRWSEQLSADIEADKTSSETTKKEERRKWTRRSTVFHEVLVPLAMDAASAAKDTATSSDTTALALNSLQTMAAAANGSVTARGSG